MSGSDLPDPSGGDEEFRELGYQLRRRGWHVRVERYSVCGESDVRLHVTRLGARAVELLGACGGRPCHDRWQAVRITDDDRVVWCGPPRGCAQDGVIVFLEDLLQRDEAELVRRYSRLG